LREKSLVKALTVKSSFLSTLNSGLRHKLKPAEEEQELAGISERVGDEACRLRAQPKVLCENVQVGIGVEGKGLEEEQGAPRVERLEQKDEQQTP